MCQNPHLSSQKSKGLLNKNNINPEVQFYRSYIIHRGIAAIEKTMKGKKKSPFSVSVGLLCHF